MTMKQSYKPLLASGSILTMKRKEFEQEDEPTWEGFYKWTEGREPRPLFLKALARFEAKSGPSSPLHAIDLGCGDGIETLALLKASWQVLAIDSEPAAIAQLQSKAHGEHQSQLETRTVSFEDLEFPETDFVYAGYSLPFCKPEYFDRLWANITASIHPGGRFAGQLFGIRDSWADNPKMTFHSAEQVNSLLVPGFEIETLREVDEDGEALSGPKHWHVFHIIARKLDQ
jgi:tellurite methyltransferase